MFQISDNYRLVNSELRKNKNYMGYITANSLGKLKIKLKCIIALTFFFLHFLIPFCWLNRPDRSLPTSEFQNLWSANNYSTLYIHMPDVNKGMYKEMNIALDLVTFGQ